MSSIDISLAYEIPKTRLVTIFNFNYTKKWKNELLTITCGLDAKQNDTKTC